MTAWSYLRLKALLERKQLQPQLEARNLGHAEKVFFGVGEVLGIALIALQSVKKQKTNKQINRLALFYKTCPLFHPGRPLYSLGGRMHTIDTLRAKAKNATHLDGLHVLLGRTHLDQLLHALGSEH